MPVTDKNKPAAGAKAASEKKTAAAPAAAPATSTKSALVKKTEDLLGKIGIKYQSVEERPVTEGGKSIPVAFVDFAGKTGKEQIKEVLWHVTTSNDFQGYHVEVDKEDEVLLVYKATH